MGEFGRKEGCHQLEKEQVDHLEGVICTLKGEEVRGDQKRRKKERRGKVQEKSRSFMCQEVELVRI